MKNKEIADIFYEMADYLEMEEVVFKPYAYERAAIVLEALEKDIAKIYKEGGKKALLKISGIGKSMAEHIEEYLKTGKIKEYQQLKKKTPVDIEELIEVEGMGPKRVKVLYQKLGIKSLKDLEKAAKAHKIALLFGFGGKTEKNILEGITFLKRSKGRFLLGEILPKVKEIEEKFKNLKEVEKISVCGSVRRRKETIGDIDFLVVTKNPKKVMDFFVSLPDIVKIWGRGRTKSSIRLKEGFDVDLRVVAQKSYGSALQYFTGSKEHNIETRKIAIDKGLKLNEYGVFRGKKMIAGWSELGVYKTIGLPWIEPELREDQGEIEAALEGKLPKVIDYQDIKGDLHCHTSWAAAAHSIEEMVQMARDNGYEYLGISDHTKFLRIERGLNERQLSEQRKEIDKLNKKFQASGFKFHVLQGAETNILKDGSIDIKDEALKKLDYAIAGVHSSFKIPKEKMTARIINAIKNPNIDIIAHPTGRILKRRDEYQIDFNKILRAAKEFGVILEINSCPQRLDLNDRNIKRAKEAGVKMVINTDSHLKEQMRFIELGIAQARRGWAEKKDIINTRPLKGLMKFFRK
jgi:DNA polymerase (family 10)